MIFMNDNYQSFIGDCCLNNPLNVSSIPILEDRVNFKVLQTNVAHPQQVTLLSWIM